jgi:hypothetical protein
MAVNYDLPNWIHGAQTAQMYAHGFPLGLEAGQAAARIHQLQAQMQLEAQKAAIEAQHQQLAITLAQQREQRESIQKQQELEVQKSYHDQMAQLKEQDIAEKQQKLDQAAQITARKYQAQATMQQRAQQLMASDPKMTLPQAYIQASFENPGAGADAGVSALARAAAASQSGAPQMPQSQTVNVGGRNVPILFNAKTGHFQVVTPPKDPLENPQALTAMLQTLNQNRGSKQAIAEVQKRLNKSLGLPEEAAKTEGPNPLQKGLDYLKSKFGSKTPSDSEIPDWAALPGEDQTPASLSDIASRIKAGPAAAETDVPDYAKLPGEDLTGPIPLPNTEKELSADETYINPKGPGLLQWNPDTKKLSVIEQPQQEEPPPETEADAPLPGEE